jgi:hypothetical protein
MVNNGVARRDAVCNLALQAIASVLSQRGTTRVSELATRSMSAMKRRRGDRGARRDVEDLTKRRDDQ